MERTHPAKRNNPTGNVKEVDPPTDEVRDADQKETPEKQDDPTSVPPADLSGAQPQCETAERTCPTEREHPAKATDPAEQIPTAGIETAEKVEVPPTGEVKDAEKDETANKGNENVCPTPAKSVHHKHHIF